MGEVGCGVVVEVVFGGLVVVFGGFVGGSGVVVEVVCVGQVDKERVMEGRVEKGN